MNEQPNKVAFVIVGWNNQDILTECFESLERQTYKNIVTYYVDNDSADESVALVKEHFPSVIILPQSQNTGFAKGNNIGIAEALKDPTVSYIALLNSDARLANDWTERLVTFAAKKPRGACYQGTTLDYYNHNVIDSTHIFVAQNGQGTQGNWRFFVTKEFGPKKVFGVNAAACMISRAFIEKQPFETLFDETLFMYLEDIDIVLRATVMGWDNYIVPGARAYHMGSASSGKNPGFSLFMTFRNNSCVIYKNYPWRLIFRMLPKLVRGDIDTIKELKRRGKRSAISKVIKGRLIGLARLPLFFIKRQKMNKVRTVDYDYLWSLMRKGY